jgi:hypothetical protein
VACRYVLGFAITRSVLFGFLGGSAATLLSIYSEKIIKNE